MLTTNSLILHVQTLLHRCLLIRITDITICVVIFEWKIFESWLAVRFFGNNVLENKAGYSQLLLLLSYFKTLVSKMPTIFNIFVNVVIQNYHIRDILSTIWKQCIIH